MASIKICSIDGCGKKHLAKGYCCSHWTRFNRHGDPLAGDTPKGAPLDFLNFARKYVGDDCLTWPYADNGNGYPVMFYPARKLTLVTRILCEEEHGPPRGDNILAAHSCNNGHLKCVNRKHLSWKSYLGNAEDTRLAGHQPKGEMMHNAKLSESDVLKIIDLVKTKSCADIAKSFNVHRGTISAIKFGRNWKHLT